MGEYTNNYLLYMPSVGEQGWGDSVNFNFIKLDAMLYTGNGIKAERAAQADTATKLTTARTINGTAFDGTSNVVTANWGTTRNITITDGTNTGTAVSVNGSGNVSLKLPTTIIANLQYSGIGGISPLAAATATVTTLTAACGSRQYTIIGHNDYEGQLTGNIGICNTSFSPYMRIHYRVGSGNYVYMGQNVSGATISVDSYIPKNSDIAIYNSNNNGPNCTAYAATLTLTKSDVKWYSI